MTKKSLFRAFCLLAFALLCATPLEGVRAEPHAPSAEELALRAAANGHVPSMPALGRLYAKLENAAERGGPAVAPRRPCRLS